MAYRIPPSLNWLIDKYARTSGEIIKLKKKLSKFQKLVDHLLELEKTLVVIEESLKLHDIKIDVANIKPIRSSTLYKNKFRNGEAGSLIIKFLKSKYGQGPVSKAEIVKVLLEEYSKLAPGMIQPTREIGIFTNNLLYRLVLKNYIIPLHEKNAGKDGWWEINPELISRENESYEIGLD